MTLLDVNAGWGSGSVGGVHLHHMVIRIIMLLVTGLLAVAFWPDSLVMGVILAILLLVGSSPFGLEDGRMPSAIFFGVVAFNLLVAVLTFLKGKLVLGMISVFVPVIGILGAVRLAKPRSLWAKHVYAPRSPEKLERARARFEASRSRYRRLHEHLDDVIGGAPSFTPMSMLDVIGGRLNVRMGPPGGDEAR